MMTQPQLETTICPICRTHNRADARFCMRCGSNIVLDDTYRVVRIVKEGGMGTVYEAVDAAGERYAMKELIDRFVDPQERVEAVQRFLEEARILRELRHPSIPRVYRSFLHGGRYYLTMDFINGEDLEELLRRNRRFDEAAVLVWAHELSEVLSYLHGKGVIYRDVKPSNIMIEHGSGAVKLVDFGIVKLFQPAQRGTLIGTPGYAPPEQYQGLATPQSDIYALGATLHHLLTGRDPRDEPPFSFPPVRALAPDVSPETAATIERALQMEPGARWPDAATLRAALPFDRRAGRPQGTTLLNKSPAASRRQSSPPRPSVPPVNQAGRAPRPATAMPRLGHRPSPQAAPLPGPSGSAARPSSRQAAHPAASRKKRKGSCLRSVASLLVLVGLLLFVAAPEVQGWVTDNLARITEALPTEQPRFGPQSLILDLQVELPSGSSDDEVDAAFRREFEVEAKRRLGPSTTVSPNVSLVYVGTIEKLDQPVDGAIVYRTRMQGQVWAPLR